jgi:hypothetical protein
MDDGVLKRWLKGVRGKEVDGVAGLTQLSLVQCLRKRKPMTPKLALARDRLVLRQRSKRGIGITRTSHSHRRA